MLARPPMLMLTQSISLVAEVAGSNRTSTSSTVPDPIRIPWLCLLHGPFNHVPETAEEVVLDLGNVTTPWLMLTSDVNSTGSLMLHKLVRVVCG